MSPWDTIGATLIDLVELSTRIDRALDQLDHVLVPVPEALYRGERYQVAALDLPANLQRVREELLACRAMLEDKP